MTNYNLEIDNAIAKRQLTTMNINTENLRRLLMHDYGLKDQLNWGKKILSSKEELAQYWYTYSKMIHDQWKHFWRIATPLQTDKPTELVDHGCGQDLASCLLFDQYGYKLGRHIKKVTLIDASSQALAAAEKIIWLYFQRFGQKVKINTVNKTIDNVEPSEVISNDNTDKIHLFSNILDMDTWNHTEYFQSLLKLGKRQTYFCVSPYRDFDGGEKRFRDIRSLIESINQNTDLHVKTNDLSIFSFRDDKDAIALDLEITNA